MEKSLVEDFQANDALAIGDTAKEDLQPVVGTTSNHLCNFESEIGASRQKSVQCSISGSRMTSCDLESFLQEGDLGKGGSIKQMPVQESVNVDREGTSQSNWSLESLLLGP